MDLILCNFYLIFCCKSLFSSHKNIGSYTKLRCTCKFIIKAIPMLIRFFKYLLVLSLVCVFSVNASESVKKLKVSLLLEHEAFLLWYAIDQGWDKKLGLDIALSVKNTSGIDLINDKRQNPGAWDICGVGSVPAVLGSSGLNITYIGMANDESNSTEILVRPESDLLKTKGFNDDYPDVYGSAESVKGKTFLVRKFTSASYVLSNYLDILGLSYKDIKVVDAEPNKFIGYMNKGHADAMILWSPELYNAQKAGYKPLASADQVDALIPVFFIVDKDYANSNAQDMGRFLALYDKAVEVQKNNVKSLVEPYKQFLKIYTGKDYSSDFCLYDLNAHTVYNLDEQIHLFAKEASNLSAVEKLERHLYSRFDLISMTVNQSNSDEIDYKHEPSDLFLKIARRFSE